MDFWHVTNQGEGKIEKENSQPTLALDLHFTISRLPEKNLLILKTPIVNLPENEVLCPNCQVSFLEMKVKSLWLAELKIAQNCSCNWRTRCPAREKSETLEVKRKSSGLLQYLSKHRLAFWNIYSIVHPEEIQNRVPHRSHPPPFLILPGDRACQGDLCLLAATHPQNCCHSLPHGRTL